MNHQFEILSIFQFEFFPHIDLIIFYQIHINILLYKMCIMTIYQYNILYKYLFLSYCMVFSRSYLVLWSTPAPLHPGLLALWRGICKIATTGDPQVWPVTPETQSCSSLLSDCLFRITNMLTLPFTLMIKFYEGKNLGLGQCFSQKLMSLLLMAHKWAGRSWSPKKHS